MIGCARGQPFRRIGRAGRGSMAEDRDLKEPIKVTDRRSFTKDGQRREPESAEGSAPRGATTAPAAQPARAAQPAPAAKPAPAANNVPPVEVRGEGFTMEP